MIEAKIARVGTEAVSDFLTDDGSQRDGTYPAVEVAFIDTDTGLVVAGKTYTLRDRSAFQSMVDITDDAQAEVARLTADLKTSPTEDPIRPEVTAQVAELTKYVGELISRL